MVVSGRRKGLGQGLDALIQKKEERSSASLPLAQIKPNRFQPRTDFDESSLEELSRSIQEKGIIQPIVVYPTDEGGYTIVAGERRWRAARMAGLKKVPVVIRKVGGEQELLELALVENLQRADLNPMEEAVAYQALKADFLLSQDDISQRVGKARSTIANALRLLNLSPEVQDLLRNGELSAGQARPLLTLSSQEKQVKMARRAVREELTARKLEELTKKDSSDGKKKKEAVVDPNDQAAVDRLTRRLQTKVQLKRKQKSGGSLVISFHTEEELMRLFELLMLQEKTNV